VLQAKRLLACAAQGFEHSHGADLSRLRALKGENCAEYALYARLHLLQGIVAYLSGTVVLLLVITHQVKLYVTCVHRSLLIHSIFD
jgi:hypothetical protein